MTDIYVWYLMRQRLEELRHEANGQRRAAHLQALRSANRAAGSGPREGRERQAGLVERFGRSVRAARQGLLNEPAPVGVAPCCDGAACCASTA